MTPEAITPVAPGLFVHAPAGATERSTLIRLPDGTVWLHAPPEWSPALQAALEPLGPVAHIVAVTPEQLSRCMDWLEHHPEARCWAPAPAVARAAQAKRRIPPTTPPPRGRPAVWSEVIDVQVAKGNGLHAVLFRHVSTGVLLVGRLIEARHRSQVPALVRTVASITGHPPKVAHTPFAVQKHFFGQRRTVVDLARWALHTRPTRVIPMRGALLNDNGAEVLADGFAWVGIDGPVPPYARFALGANPGGAVAFLIAAAFTAGLLLGLDLPASSMVARVVTAVVVADILAGIVAMSSPSTRKWWRGQGPAWMAGFLGIHIIHPLALVAVHGGDGVWGAGLWLMGLLGGALVWLWPTRGTAAPLAMLVVGLGTMLFSADAAGPEWLAGLYLLKLVGCFSFGVRPDTDHH